MGVSITVTTRTRCPWNPLDWLTIVHHLYHHRMAVRVFGFGVHFINCVTCRNSLVRNFEWLRGGVRARSCIYKSVLFVRKVDWIHSLRAAVYCIILCLKCAPNFLARLQICRYMCVFFGIWHYSRRYACVSKGYIGSNIVFFLQIWTFPLPSFCNMAGAHLESLVHG